MSVNRFSFPFFQAFSGSTGRVGAGWKLYFWATGTTDTAQTTYSDSDLTTPNANPVVSDANGRWPDIFLANSLYAVELTDENDVQIDFADPVGTATDSTAVVSKEDDLITIASDGQTTITITNFTYTPGANMLLVARNGTLMKSGVDYQETTATTLTWIGSGDLSAGDEFYIIKNQFISSSAPLAANTAYTPAGTGAVPTDVQTKLREFVSVKDFGAVGDGVTDDTAAIQAAIDYCESNENKSLFFPAGTYLVTGTIYIGSGVTLIGEGNTASRGTCTTILHNFNSTLFYFDSSESASLPINTGGGVSKMLLVKGTGYSGGNAIIVYNADNDGATNKRASTFEFSELTIYGEGTGLWQRAILFDGLQYSTAGSRGLRNFSLYKIRVSDCTEDDEYILLRQVTHLTADLIQIDTGSGTGVAGMTIEGYSQNVLLSNCNINGRLYIPSGATIVDFLFTGHLSEIDNQNTTASGLMLLTTSPTSTNQASDALRLDDTSGYGRRYLLAGTKSGYSNKIFATYSGTTELARWGSISSSVQSLLPLLNDGQFWIYGNAFNYETSGLQTAYRFEYSRFRPSNDNGSDLGNGSNRWAVVYAGTGTINTSDEREKTFLTIEDAEKSAALEIKANLRKFKWNDSIDKKGDDARIHFGANAQQIGAIMKSHGLDPNCYGFYCYDEWETELNDDGTVITEGGNRYGLRYSELLCFLMMAGV